MKISNRVVVGLFLIIGLASFVLVKSDSVAMLDIHDEASNDFENLKFLMLKVPGDFLEEFDSAFKQIASLDADSLPDFRAVPKGISLAYSTLMDHPIKTAHAAMRATTSDCNSNSNQSVWSIRDLDFNKILQL